MKDIYVIIACLTVLAAMSLYLTLKSYQSFRAVLITPEILIKNGFYYTRGIWKHKKDDRFCMVKMSLGDDYLIEVNNGYAVAGLAVKNLGELQDFFDTYGINIELKRF